jgi:toxin ParE1/3/4
VVLRPLAEGDAVEQIGYLAAEAGREVALRFAVRLENAFEQIARHPLIGRPWPTRHAGLLGIRRMILTDFPISIFYRPTPGTIDVLRVLHHRRDLPPDLDPDV